MPFLPVTATPLAKKSSAPVQAAASTGVAPRVSVLIPTRNAGVGFAQTLQAVTSQALDEPYEVIAIDSGSRDGTPERCEVFGVRVLQIEPRTFGHGRTRNQGIAAARGELVALLVQDAVPADPHWLASLVSALDAEPEAAGAYSRHLPHAGAGPIARYAAEYWYRHQGGRVVQRIADPSAFAALQLEEKKLACTFNDVSSMVRRAVWERIPLRDLAFAEDLGWGYDVLRAGHSVIYEPASQVYHSHERPLSYEFRRAYVEERVVGELFGAPADVLSLREALSLAGLWRRTGARADDTSDWATLLEEMRPQPRDRDWFAQRFDLQALAGVLGPRAPWPRAEQADIIYLLDRAGQAAYAEAPAGARPFLERLKDAVGWLDDWQIEAGQTQRYPGPERPMLSDAELRLAFGTLWDEIGRDYVRRAVLESPDLRSEAWHALRARAQRQPGSDWPDLEERVLLFAAALMQEALAANELDPALYGAIWRYAGAVVIGQRLGAANRYGLAGRWGRALQFCLARGI